MAAGLPCPAALPHSQLCLQTPAAHLAASKMLLTSGGGGGTAAAGAPPVSTDGSMSPIFSPIFCNGGGAQGDLFISYHSGTQTVWLGVEQRGKRHGTVGCRTARKVGSFIAFIIAGMPPALISSNSGFSSGSSLRGECQEEGGVGDDTHGGRRGGDGPGRGAMAVGLPPRPSNRTSAPPFSA